MLSSLNAYGGLSAAELMALFGVNSSSSSSSATSKNTARSASTGISGSSANTPANAIQAILAQAQSSAKGPANAIQAILAQAQMETSAGGSASIATVAAAYAAQTDSSGAGSTTSVTTETAYTVQMGSSNSQTAASADTMSAQYSSNEGMNGDIISASYSVTSTPSASGSIDNFQMSLTLGNDTLNIHFTVDGLGQVGPLPLSVGGLGPFGLSAGQGNDGEMLGVIATGSDGTDTGIEFTVGGLDAAQDLQVAEAFEAATSSPSETRIETEGPNYIQYDENLGQGFTATFSAGGAYSLTPAQMAASGA